MGITQALGGLDTKQLAVDPEPAMKALLAGQYVAFDTTAEALSLHGAHVRAILIDRIDMLLLSAVDSRASEELSGRIRAGGGTGSDLDVASIERMGDRS